MYDRVNSWGGAERVLLALHELWPDAPLFTSVYDKARAGWASVFDVKPSWLQNIPFFNNKHQFLSLLTPHAFRQFDFSGYDLVLSISSAEAKYIHTQANTKHICYCLTPTRYLWSLRNEYEEQGLSGKVLRLTAPLSRITDFEASQKPDEYISISNYIKEQVHKYYQRESMVIYPPVDTVGNKPPQDPPGIQNYYLVVSRLVFYKRVDLAIRACNKLGYNLVVVGSGKEMKNLKRIAGPTVTFAGNLTEQELSRYYMHCKALLFPGVEDFGIVPLEAQSFGKPVVAYGKGGVLDTVKSGITGIFFYKQSTEDLIKAIGEFELHTFKAQDCIENVRTFSKDIFKEQIKKYIEEIIYNS